MADPEHLKILCHGVERFNRWREEHPDTPVDLSSVKTEELQDSFLWDDIQERITLDRANLSHVNLMELLSRPSIFPALTLTLRISAILISASHS